MDDVDQPEIARIKSGGAQGTLDSSDDQRVSVMLQFIVASGSSRYSRLEGLESRARAWVAKGGVGHIRMP